MVCVEHPIVGVPDISKSKDGDMIHCPVCEKWLATASVDKHNSFWSTEDEVYLTDDGNLIKNYPVKIHH